MIINLDGEKPENISQEVWANAKEMFNAIISDEEDMEVEE